MNDVAVAELPPNWNLSPLCALGEWHGGGTPSKSNRDFWTGGTIPWVSPKDMKSFEIHDTEDHITEEGLTGSASTKVRPGTLLLVTRSGILRRTLPVAIARREVALNQDLKALTLADKLDPRFVAYAIQALEHAILHRCMKDGTTVQSIEFLALQRVEVPVAPSEEQARVADALDELFSDLDAAVGSVEHAREKLKAYRASVLKAAVDGTLTAEWREEHPYVEPAPQLLERILAERRRAWEMESGVNSAASQNRPDRKSKATYKERPAVTTAGPIRLPPTWTWASLDELANLSGGVTKGQRLPSDAKTRDVPYLRVANVQRGFLDLAEIKTILATEDDIEALRLVPGDVLFNEGGDRDKLGRGWIWQGEIDECIHQNHVFRARLISASVQPKFVSWCGNSYGQRWFMRAGRQSVNLASINLTVLRSFPVALPPAEEQEAIVEIVEDQLSIIDHLESELKTKLQTAQSLRQSILRHAFSGKLVPQDPNDEPASKLLERIAAERAARQTPPRRRKTSRTTT